LLNPLLSCGPNPVRWTSDPTGARRHHAHTAETAYAALGKAERRARRVNPDQSPFLSPPGRRSCSDTGAAAHKRHLRLCAAARQAILTLAMMEPRIFVLEDDPQMRSLLVRGLREEGYEVQGFATGSELLRKTAEIVPELFIIDIGLPDTDGRDVCQAIRAQGVKAPVLFLTARDTLSDRLSGFNVGGDDYLSKPFAFAELLARLEALIRRSGAERTVEAAGLILDPAKHAVTFGGETVPLTPTEFRLLAKLASSPGEAIRRKALIETGWSHGAIVYDNSLDAYIARLRRKVCALPEAPQIVTVRGVGYSLQ
jgi:two-component system OmpR family response regulator